MTEETRALAYRVSAARRRAAESARCARLVGSPSAYLALRAATLPLLNVDAAGVPRQHMGAGSTYGGGEQGQGEQDDRECP